MVLVDWWEVLYSFIGGFLGFGFALLTEALVSTLKRINDMNTLSENLLDELLSIANDLRGNESEVVPIYFETPVWTAITSTGILLSLMKHNKGLYDAVIIVYNRVFALKDMERQIEQNIQDIVFIRTDIVERIDKIVLQEKKV